MSSIIKRTPIVPTTWEEVVAAAKYVFSSGLCPDTIKTPEQAAVVILSGAELGVGMMVSLHELFPIEKNIGMSTKLMIALVKQHGGDIRVIEQGPLQATTQLHLPSGKACAPVTITLAQAQKAHYHQYWKKESGDEKAHWQDKPAWIQHPDLMLVYRSASRNIRLNMPQPLMGMPTVDEAQDLEDGQTIIEGTAHVMDSEPEQPKAEAKPPPPAPAPAPTPQASEPPRAEQPASSSNGQGATWTTNENRIKALHAWISDACRIKAVNLTWETIKTKALHVEHLEQFTGTEGDAQRAILALIADILKEAGNPTQTRMETAK